LIYIKPGKLRRGSDGGCHQARLHADAAAHSLSSSRVIIMQFSRPSEPSRRLVLGALAALPAFSTPRVASAQTQTPAAQALPPAGFSFVAVGDTRPMMYLPLREGQPDLSKFFVEMFGLIMPE
jgi:hypothetical protein